MSDIVDLLQELPQAITPGPAGPDLVAADVARGHRALGRRRGYRLAGVAGVAAAGALAIVLAIPSAPRPVSPTGPTGPTGPIAKSPANNATLVTLAARISARAGSERGNASLQIVSQVIGGKLMQTYYGLFTNSGQLYSGDDKKTLIRAVARHENQADGTDVREVDAARYAETGNLAVARKRMVNATPNDFFDSLAVRKKIWAQGAKARRALLRAKGIKTPLKMPTGKALRDEINNSLWTNSTDALNWAGGDSAIRAGVLRLLSTIPEVTVTKSTTHRLRTLTITAGPAVFGGSGKEVLTVNAATGLPVKSVSTTPGVPAGVETYRVSRVTLAGIEAGKF
jgi:hypothetical protein